MLKTALEELHIKSELYSFPNRETDIGSLIDKYLKNEIKMSDRAIHLLFSANRWEIIDEIKSKLNDGVSIIMDRYVYSGIAYSLAKGNLDYEWCMSCDKGLPKPDFIYFLNSDFCKENFDEEIYEEVEFQKRVCEEYSKLLCREKDIFIIESKNSMMFNHKIILEHFLSSNKILSKKSFKYF